MKFLAFASGHHRSKRERRETSPLLLSGKHASDGARGYEELKPDVEPQPLRRRDVPHATDSVHRAFVHDSLMVYYAVSPLRARPHRARTHRTLIVERWNTT
ncbi:hypothetical protein NUW54_g12667 [Trametes sanguinea]|uniref:Uncharacterized protein n=1 Tax=Trametes sanguinea TaxID=158606 RepID=A0ACC1MVN6_9APHY|nr:hypothetical protein NUW54_g12667 [Trametes sanguinea]